MATFTQWLKEQEGREGDPVGWFAQFWRDLEGKPRLSAVHSVTKHLEDRNLFQLTPGLTEAHDAALAEYRHQREAVMRPVPQERGLAGQAVDRATEAGLAAAAKHAQPEQVQGELFSAELVSDKPQLDRIEAKLDEIRAHLGLAVTADRIASGPVTMASWSLDWGGWFAQADLAAVPDE